MMYKLPSCRGIKTYIFSKKLYILQEQISIISSHSKKDHYNVRATVSQNIRKYQLCHFYHHPNHFIKVEYYRIPSFKKKKVRAKGRSLFMRTYCAMPICFKINTNVKLLSFVVQMFNTSFGTVDRYLKHIFIKQQQLISKYSLCT